MWVYYTLCLEVWSDLFLHSKREWAKLSVGVVAVPLASHTWSEMSCLTVLHHQGWGVPALSSLSGWLLWQDASAQWINHKINVRLLQGKYRASFLTSHSQHFYSSAIPLLFPWHSATALWKSKVLIVKLPLHWRHTGFIQCSAPGDHFIWHSSFSFFPSLHLTKQSLIFKRMPHC